MQDLKITVIQSDLYWQNTDANLGMFEEKLWQIEEKTDIIVLPEMFTTGFTMDAKPVAEPMNFKTFKWMKQQSAQTQAVVVGSFVVKEGGGYFNRLIWMEPDGQYGQYDKRHLFRMANENDHYQSGNELLTREWQGWKIRPFICYDLRFPVWSRNRFDNDKRSYDYDLALYIANWPSPRVSAWDTLLKARAIENQSYVIGINRIGQDGNGLDYAGHSAIIGPKGDELFFFGKREEIKTVSLSAKNLHKYRDKFPVYLDADEFSIMN